MKKPIFNFVIILLLGLEIAAQITDKTVENIRRHYSDISEKARLCETDDDRGEFGDLVMNELAVNKRKRQWRAVGNYGLTYKFFYKGGDSEKSLYPDQLMFVRAERYISDRVYLEEYLYSERGILLFYFQKSANDDQTPTERSIYFSGIKPIRFAEDAKTRDRLTARDFAVIREINEQSRRIKELFLKSIKL